MNQTALNPQETELVIHLGQSEFRSFILSSVPFIATTSAAYIYSETQSKEITSKFYNNWTRSRTSAFPPPSKFYRRPMVNKSWSSFDRYKHMTFVGPPGSGKSALVLHYGLSRDGPKKRFLYLKGDNERFTLIWYRTQTARYETCNFHAPGYRGVTTLLDNLLRHVLRAPQPILEVALVIVDGFTADLQTSFHGVMFPPAYKKTFRFLRCLSWQIHRTGQNAKSVCQLISIVVNGWSAADYALALRNGSFPWIITAEAASADEDVLAAIIDERMYYSGGNCRLFASGGSYWRCSILEKIDGAIMDIGQLTLEQLYEIKKGSIPSANTLFTFDDKGMFGIVSEYATKALLGKVQYRDLAICNAMYYRYSFSDRAMLMKLDVLTRMATNDRFELFPGGGGVAAAVTWTATGTPKVFKCFDARNIKVENIAVGTYFLPTKWNQGSFDGIFLKSRHTACFFLITAAPDHIFRGDELRDYINALRVHRVEFYYICHPRNHPNFARPNPTAADLASINKRLKTQQNNKRRQGTLPSVVDPEHDVSITLHDFSYEPY